MWGQEGVGAGMGDGVAEVDDVGMWGGDLLQEGGGFGDREVGGVWFWAEAVEDHEVEVMEAVEGLGGDGLAIGDESGGVVVGIDSPAIHMGAAVGDGERGKADGADGEGGWGDGVELDSGEGGSWEWGEGEVMEDAGGVAGGTWGSVNGEGFGHTVGVGAEVIEAEEVVGVGMGEEDEVEGRDVGAEALGSEVWWRIEEDTEALGFDEDGGTEAVVAWVWGGTDGAMASGDGDTVGGAGTEERDTHGGQGVWGRRRRRRRRRAV